jgi:ferredoxin
MGWDREQQWRKLLTACSAKATKAIVQELADICCADHKQASAEASDRVGSWYPPDAHTDACISCLQCYKAVPALISRQYRKGDHTQQVNVLYAVNKILRVSKKQLKGHSRYGEDRVVSARSQHRYGLSLTQGSLLFVQASALVQSCRTCSRLWQACPPRSR